GAQSLMQSMVFIKYASLLGGLAMAYMAWGLYRSAGQMKINNNPGYGAVLGGVVFTALNPSFPLWWATAGLRLVLEGFQVLGGLGAILVVFGHWIADLGWYVFVSATVYEGGRKFLTQEYVVNLRRILATILVMISIYFMYSAFI
ncbi:MAG: hypothetical protein GF334_10195, partial [Candidatus Altiarchaeales archaeon]|nr:hypothetical protein [Candidatus Altiarchaeales archaeon]